MHVTFQETGRVEILKRLFKFIDVFLKYIHVRLLSTINSTETWDMISTFASTWFLNLDVQVFYECGKRPSDVKYKQKISRNQDFSRFVLMKHIDLNYRPALSNFLEHSLVICDKRNCLKYMAIYVSCNTIWHISYTYVYIWLLCSILQILGI